MPITLVTSLPKSPPSSANEAPTDTDAPDAGRDFASMLFGQLTQSANEAAGKELLLSGENGTEKTTATDKDDEPSDALALLAALGAPTTSRADASLPAGIAPADIAKAAAHTVSGNADPIAASKAVLAAQQSNTSAAESTVSFEESMTTATADPASRKPATFAVPDSAPKDGGALMTAQSGETTPSSHSVPSTHTAIATAASGHAVSRSEIETTSIPSPWRTRSGTTISRRRSSGWRRTRSRRRNSPLPPEHGQYRGLAANRQRPGDSHVRLKQCRRQGKHRNRVAPLARNARRCRHFARPDQRQRGVLPASPRTRPGEPWRIAWRER